MDSKPGYCWKCDEPKNDIVCTRCQIAKYCSNKCMKEDNDIHKMECIHLGTKIRTCPGCNQVKPSRRCCRCAEATYCSVECQRRDWKHDSSTSSTPSHKTRCNFIKNLLTSVGEFAIPNYFNGLPWYWGNQCAIDWLNLSHKEGAEYEEDINILSIGCGNLGSLFLTTASIPDEFNNKINFVMDDKSPHMMARNILFYHMVYILAGEFQASGKEHEVDKKCRLISQVMYSLRLSMDARNYLVSTLETLIHMKKDEFHIGSPEGIVDVLKLIWTKWKDLAFNTKAVDDMKRQRREPLNGEIFLAQTNQLIATIPERHVESCKKWFDDGIFAPDKDTETRELMAFPNSTLTMINPSFDGIGPERVEDKILKQHYVSLNMDDEMVYSVRGDSTPLFCWRYDDASRLCNSDDLLKMMDEYFRHVLQKVIRNLDRIRVEFIIDDFNNIEMYIPSGQTFDRIATSNLADYIPHIYGLVKRMSVYINKKNKHSVLLTSLMNWIHHPIFEYSMILQKSGTADLDREIEILGKKILRKELLAPVDYWPIFLNYLRLMLQEHLGRKRIVNLRYIWRPIYGMKLARFDLFENTVTPFLRSKSIKTILHERNLEFIVAGSEE